MKAFAVFTMHEPAEAAWIEAGCAFIPENPAAPNRALWKGEPVGERIAVLRKTYGGALRDMAQQDAAALGGVCIHFDNASGFPDSGECYAALRAVPQGDAAAIELFGADAWREWLRLPAS